MKKAAVILVLGLVGWHVLGWLRGGDSPRLSDEQRQVVEARVAAYSPVRTRPALFLPPLPGDAGESYARALEIADGLEEEVGWRLPSDYIHDVGASLPATLAEELSKPALRQAAEAIVEGTRRPTMTLRPRVGPEAMGWFRLGRGVVLLALDDFRRGDTGSAFRLAMAVQRYANDLSRQSLLSGALFTILARDSAHAVRMMVESGRLDPKERQEVAALLDRLRGDAPSPADALLGESYLLDTMILEQQGGSSLRSDLGGMWKKAMSEYDGDWLRGYVEINGRLREAWQDAASAEYMFAVAGADDTVHACVQILGSEERFCKSVASMFTVRAEAEIHLRDAQIAALR
jgi:hypothetical protein